MKLCIKNLADQNGYTKIRLAKELDMSRQYIYSLYDGSVKSIKIENIEKLCEIFHCTPNDLFINDDKNYPITTKYHSDHNTKPTYVSENATSYNTSNESTIDPQTIDRLKTYFVKIANDVFDERNKDDTE